MAEITAPILTVADLSEWKEWLKENENKSNGVRLTLAKKGVTSPTSLTYFDALNAALCRGWVDGRRSKLDESTFSQHFTPRRKRSLWSKRNVKLVEALIESGEMQERGFQEIELAKADGRWGRAYEGSSNMEVPADFLEALAKDPAAAAVFESLNKSARHPILVPIVTSPPDKRALRIEKSVKKLSGLQES